MKKLSRMLVATAALLVCASGVWAQSWPSRSVTVVVPYPPGGTNDVVARLYADRLSTTFGQPFIVENRAGAAGMIGSASVARAAPDGYVLLVGNNATHVIQPLVSSKVQYDSVKDFTPVAMLVEAPQFLGVNAALNVNSVADLVALAKREPGKLNYCSAGSGSFGNFAGELFKLLTGIDAVHVPYRGSSAAVTDLAAGRVQFMFDPVVVPQRKTGKIKVIATSNPERFPGLPDVPTMKEAGLPQFTLTGWFAMFGPANLPKDIVSKLYNAISSASRDAELQKRVLASGILPSLKGPEELAAALKGDLQLYADIKRPAHIEVVQ